MALKNFTQFTPQTVLSATDFVVGYRALDEIRTDLDSLTVAISGLLIAKGFTPGGTSSGTVRRVSYRYTIGASSNLNAVSGVDDYSLNLSYTPGQIEVYRNGSHLVESLDFIASNSTQVTNMSTFSLGDIIEVVALSATGVTITSTLTGNGTIISPNYRYTVPTTLAAGAVLVTGADDYGAVLNYGAPNLDVYLNGSHLVNSYDYIATTGTSITLMDSVCSGDVLDVRTLSAIGLSNILTISGYAGVSRIVAQNGVATGPTGGVGVVTLSADIAGLTTKASPASNDQVMIFDVVGNTNKKTTVATLTSLAATAAGLSGRFILLQDKKPNKTNSGTFTDSGWRTRDLTTEVFDTGGDCTLAANQFTLVAGTYEIYATAPAYGVRAHRILLKNVTDGLSALVGTSEVSNTTYAACNSYSNIRGMFTIAAPKAFEIQHYCQSSGTDDGYGAWQGGGTSVGSPGSEVYTEVLLKRII